jgi:dihydroorotate dehydrogenase electron transfer subunit
MFCYGARTAGDFVLLDRIEPLVDQLVLTTNDGSKGTKEFVTEAAERYFAPGVSIFTCGPNPMMDDLLRRMRRHGLEGQVSLENQMGCGIGACQGCVVTTREGYRRICCEGPVLPTTVLDSIGW